jgi:hypothetical protein
MRNQIHVVSERWRWREFDDLLCGHRLFVLSLSQTDAQEDAAATDFQIVPLIAQTPHDVSPDGYLCTHLSRAVGVKGC